MAFGRNKDKTSEAEIDADIQNATPSTDGKASIKVITAKLVKSRYELALKATIYERRDYWLNYAFLRGRQWIYWNNQTKRIDDVARVRGRYQATIDRLSPSSRTLISDLTQQPLTFDVPPSAADDDSIAGARTAEAILRDAVIQHKWEDIREDLAWALWTGGTAGLCIDWDSSYGDQISVDDDGPGIYIGDICETVMTIPEFVVEPGARRAEFARWWIKAVIHSPETVQSMFPDQFPSPPPMDAQSSNSPYNQRIVTSDDQALNIIHGTLVLTYYERPNALNPKGSVTTIVDSKIVEQKDWPFPWTDRLNLVVFKETPVNGRWTGETVLSKAAKVQVAYNAAWSNYLEHLKKVGNARLLIPASQMEMNDALVDDPGKPLRFMDGPNSSLPQYLAPPQLPAWVRDIIADLRSEIDTIIGITDVQRGIAPSNAPDSGYGFEILNQNSKGPIGRISNEMARGWGAFASMALKLYEDNVETTHTATVSYANKMPQSIEWTGKDLAKQTTAIVPLDAIMPRSRAATQKFVEQMMNMRPDLFPNIATIARSFEIPGAEDLINAIDEQQAQAERYCHYMAQGQMIKPEPWHNGGVFITEINRFRCTPKFDALPDKTKSLFDMAANAYEELEKEKLGKRRAQATMDPALATMPDANGTPPLPPQMMPPQPNAPVGGGAPGGPPSIGPGPGASSPMPPVGG